MSMIGKTLAHYEITAPIGRGGMGEVFKAKDQKLGRDVAIKVLPEGFARDTDRVARFQREAKLLASLNHPNIAAIYGLEESGGTNFLVLELVDGDTLADRIKEGPIPVEESLKLALQIAEALEAAHEKGVIHRDLKPANIKVTSKGMVKVLDFGLAKAFAGDKADLDLSDSATMSMLETQSGVILGTAAYMSPEQARAEMADKRVDIWAFGVVLYEMLTGWQLFSARTISETIAAVLTKEPDLAMIPAAVQPLLRRCLQKDPNRRLRDIGDVMLEMEEVLANPSGVLVQPAITEASKRRLRLGLPWIAAIVVLSLIIAGVAVWKFKPPEPRQVMRFYYELPEGQQFSDLNFPVLAVSPDGRLFVYSTPKGLQLRSVDELTAKLIPGTEGSTQQPFFSPDGKSIGYFSVTDRQLKKIAINGGAPVRLCDVLQPLGASWSADNTIVYCQYIGDMMRISANGGTPEPLIKITGIAGEYTAFPQILPDDRSVLYTGGKSAYTRMSIKVHSLKSGGSKELFAGVGAYYLPSGNIVYGLPNDSTVFAIPFDLEGLNAAGEPVRIIEGVGSPPHYAISDSGTLVYIPQTTSAAPKSTAASGRTLVWVDRKGREEPLAARPNMYRFPNISPDGTKVAIMVESDIWIWDLARKIPRRLTFDGNNGTPVWTPDGKRIVFYSFSSVEARHGIRWKAADGTGQTEQLGSKSGIIFFPYSWSDDGKNLIGQESQDLQQFYIGMLSMEGDHARKTLLRERDSVMQPKISPNGRWIAYASGKSPNHEIYVCSFPDVSKGRWQISTSGGDSPLWSPDGRDLFYLSGDAVMAVSVTTEPNFNTVGTPQILFRGKYVGAYPADGTPWDIHPDGKHFLMMKEAASTEKPAAAEPPRKINIVVNWLEELKQRVPVP